MRIALVITELDPGGAELCLTELALYLTERGHVVSVLALGPAPRTNQTGLLERLNAAGIVVQFGNARGTRDAWRIARWLRRALTEFQPDVVQSMLWHANVTTGWALWNGSVPWVAGIRVSEPRSGRWWLQRLVSRRMQHLVCVSQQTQQHAIEKEHIAASLISVIPNGVRLPESDATTATAQPTLQQLGIESSAPAILFVGRLETQKGVPELAAHLPELLQRLPDWQLILVGQGSLRPMIAERIKAHHLTGRVHLVGWQPNSLAWMSASQMLILPAIYEGMPNVLLEAMSRSRPFVAFAVDGVQQLIHPQDGYPSDLAAAQIAQPGNWPELLARIETLAGDESLRQRCGQANRVHVSQHFRLEDQLRKYEELYLKLSSHPTG